MGACSGAAPRGASVPDERLKLVAMLVGEEREGKDQSSVFHTEVKPWKPPTNAWPESDVSRDTITQSAIFEW
jgi:hypothetical protein